MFALLLAVGCGGGRAAPPPPPPPPAPAPSSVSVLDASRPVRLLIPSINVDSGPIMDLGLQPDGTMQVPPDGTQTGWYVDSPTPGERGPAILAAHVDWKGVEGVFFSLHKMKPGDLINVKRADGSTARFTVSKVDKYPKDAFPTDDVYGNVDNSQLRLITCGGEFDHAAQSYRDNIVVYADLVI